MAFQTSKDVLDWYEKQQPTLTKEFIDAVPWHTVGDTPLEKKLVPVLLYMRDVETLTDMYYRELRRTPTGRDPVIARFMERWGVEEETHGELLNRFLNEAGHETPTDWKDLVRRNVSTTYHAYAYLITSLTNLLGSRFTATHMTFGAIHEMSTAQAYRRVKVLADHPVLSLILDGIMREESAHTHFYWSVAKLELQKSPTAQKIARKVIDTFWRPVGQGSLPKMRTDYTIATLFGGDVGIDQVDRTVTQRARQLPGFDGLNQVTKRIADICLDLGTNKVVPA